MWVRTSPSVPDATQSSMAAANNEPEWICHIRSSNRSDRARAGGETFDVLERESLRHVLYGIRDKPGVSHRAGRAGSVGVRRLLIGRDAATLTAALVALVRAVRPFLVRLVDDLGLGAVLIDRAPLAAPDIGLLRLGHRSSP